MVIEAHRIALLASCIVLAGCGAGSETSGNASKRGAPASSEQGCFGAWNAAENQVNRERVAREGYEIARVGLSRTFADPPAPGTSGTSEGCGFLFHSDERHLSFAGDWNDWEIRNLRPTLEGPWSDQQQRNSPDNALVDTEGQVERITGPRKPMARGSGVPPPAFVETTRGSYWLGYSSFCWRALRCADFVVPSCSDGAHVPTLDLHAGEVVRFVLPFRPRSVTLTFHAEQVRGDEDPDQRRLTPRRVTEWTVDRSGAFALSARAEAFAGEAGYAACIR